MNADRHENSAQTAHRAVNRCSSILLAAWLTGCARFVSQPISPADNAAQLDARRLDDAGLKKFLERNRGHVLEAWPLKVWDFETLTLAAFYFNPSLDLARAQWSAAQAGVQTAGGRPNPTLNLTPGDDLSGANGGSARISFFRAGVPGGTAGKPARRIAKGSHLSDRSPLNIATLAREGRRD